MRMFFAAAAAVFTLAAVGPALAADGPAGEWVVADHTAVVRITKCPGGYCGFVAKGQPGKDYRNPDPSKRNRSVIGIEVMFNMKQSGPASWSGETYNADDGQVYNGKITLTSANTLNVEGCVPGGGVCGSQSWTRR